MRIIEILSKYWPYYVKGVFYTLGLSFVSLILGSILGLLLSLMKLSKSNILNKLSGAYISIFRGTPMMIQLFIIHYGITLTFGIDINAFVSGLLTVGLNSAAYVAEIIRSGIQSIDKGQVEAGRSLGLTEAQTMKNIILPQAIKNILPALGNELVTLVKETSIVSTIGVTDLMGGSNKTMTAIYNPSPLLIGAVLYFMINLVLSKILESFEKKVAYND